MIKVRIELKETSQALEYGAINTYTKGPFYCVYVKDKGVYKFPIANIWRVNEDYASR